MKVYKIANKDGQFSKGGSWPRFGITGKTWTSIGHLKTHLRGIARIEKYADCTILCFDIVETLVEKTAVSDMIAAQARNDRAKAEKARAKAEKSKTSV